MNFTSSQVFINKLNNLFNGLIALPLLLVGYGYLEITYRDWEAVMSIDNAILISTIVGMGALVSYLSLRFKKESRNLTVFDDIQVKMEAYYRLASFYYWSVFALSITTTALLFFFAHVAYAVLYAFILFWMSVFRPTVRSLTDLFALEDEEKRKFLKNEPLN
ncbi:MAG: hypothetical protein DRI71_08495 [Bacteroidetes bacterium]|nr:MAG: hypothetical protein DRI71_08495 [Bacteroidota bacterium]